METAGKDRQKFRQKKERNKVRKLLMLVAVLALLAIPAVPAAAQTVVSGDVPTPVLTLTPPPAIGFGTFALGLNSGTAFPSVGGVSVANEVVGVTTWTVTTSASETYGRLWNGAAAYFYNSLQISSGGAYQNAQDPLTYASNPTVLNLYAQQTTVADDFNVPGTYGITITFTGSLTF